MSKINYSPSTPGLESVLLFLVLYLYPHAIHFYLKQAPLIFEKLTTPGISSTLLRFNKTCLALLQSLSNLPSSLKSSSCVASPKTISYLVRTTHSMLYHKRLELLTPCAHRVQLFRVHILRKLLSTCCSARQLADRIGTPRGQWPNF